MSKITPKNLHYDSSLPPFLARLQANNDTRDGRHEFSIARPKKARNADEDAEDEPVYFNEESGETLTKSEWEARDAADEEAKAETADVAGDSNAAALKTEGAGAKEGKEKIAGIGATKKRKAGKIVGGEDEDVAELVKAKKDEQTQAPKDSKKGDKAKPAKKARKIKLSFDE